MVDNRQGDSAANIRKSSFLVYLSQVLTLSEAADTVLGMAPTPTDLESLRWAVELLRFAKERKAELKTLEEQARDAIEAALGDNDLGSLDGHIAVTWKTHTQTRLDQQALKKTFPDIYEACRKTSDVRRFEVLDAL